MFQTERAREAARVLAKYHYQYFGNETGEEDIYFHPEEEAYSINIHDDGRWVVEYHYPHTEWPEFDMGELEQLEAKIVKLAEERSR